MELLTDRELEVLQRIGKGMSNREIASEFFISVKTVETHREHLKQKLQMPSSGDLLRYAIEFYRVQN
jgi:DNA-binding CsgD family transcriptional regulator